MTAQHPVGHASLRNWPKPEPPPQPSVESGIDRVFRDAARAARQQHDRKDTPVQGDGIHSMADIPGRIAALEAEGVTQLTAADVKAMKPEEIVAAQREGRLLAYVSTPNGGYRTSSAG